MKPLLKKLIYLVCLQIITLPSLGYSNINGTITERKDNLIKVEFLDQYTITPEIGDEVRCVTTMSNIEVKAGSGLVSKVGKDHIWAKVSSGRPNITHSCQIIASKKTALPTEQPDGHYPSSPLAVTKAFLKLFLTGDIISAAKYIAPEERERELKSFQADPGEDLSALRVEQFTFQKIQIEGDRATVFAKSPGDTEAERFGKMLRVDGKWYVTFGNNPIEKIPTKSVLDKKGNWRILIPLDWEEDNSSSGEWAIYRPSVLGKYQAHIRVLEVSVPKQKTTPEKMREKVNFTADDPLKRVLVEAPRYAKLGGYVNPIFLHFSGINLVKDLNLPQDDQRWHWFGYDLTTQKARYYFVAVCREDFYSAYGEELKEILSSVMFK
jgi:hypothetical protein